MGQEKNLLNNRLTFIYTPDPSYTCFVFLKVIKLYHLKILVS